MPDMKPDPAMTAAMEAGDWSAYAEAAYEKGRREGLEAAADLAAWERHNRGASSSAYERGACSASHNIEGAIREHARLAAPHTPEARIVEDKP